MIVVLRAHQNKLLWKISCAISMRKKKRPPRIWRDKQRLHEYRKRNLAIGQSKVINSISDSIATEPQTETTALQESVETQVEKSPTKVIEPSETIDPSDPKLQSEEPHAEIKDNGLDKFIPAYDFNVLITTYKFDEQNQRIMF